MYSTQMRELKAIYDKQLVDPLFNDLRSKKDIQFIPGMGPLNPKIMLIGEQPGKAENDTGKPFQGQAGSLLNGVLAAVNLDKKDIYFTNVVKYWPRESDTANRARKITVEEFDAFADYLDDEIYTVNPDIVGLCGRAALQAVFPEMYEVATHHGELLDGVYVPLFNPAVLKYTPNKFPSIVSGFSKLKKYLNTQITA